MDSGALFERLRGLCMSMPEATEKPSHGESAWFVRGKSMFAISSDRHHDDRVAFWCAAPPGAAEALVARDGTRYFVPPYVGHRGWLGVYLDVDPIDWEEVEDLVTEAWRTVAPKRLLASFDADRT
jgi:hypothetical protein